MNERLGDQPPSTARQMLLDRFSTQEEKEEYVRRGIIPTNNLGLRMLVVDAGPSSDLWEFYRPLLFTDRMIERLEEVRSREPELWQTSLEAHHASTDLVDQYISAMQQFGFDSVQAEAVGAQSNEASWYDKELRSKIFEVMDQEPLTEAEALALCI